MRNTSLLLLIALLAFAACVREPERPPPAPLPAKAAAATIESENLQPEPTIQLEIIDLQNAVDSHAKRIFLSGTLVNHGTRPTSQVTVRIDALDENGDAVVTTAAMPSTDHIPADGGMAKFTAEIDTNPAIRSYHVEAVAR